MRLGAALGVVALLLPATARATTGLEWKIDGPVRYVIHAQLQLPELMRLYAQRNKEVRVSEVRFAVVTTCTPDETFGHSWELMCKIDDLALEAAPVETEADLVLPVLDDWDTVLTGASMQLVFTRDGRVRDVDLEHPNLVDDNQRTSQMLEDMRQLLRRVFVAFDLQLPKKGDDHGHPWTQRESPVLGFPTGQGTMGSAPVTHAVTGAQGDEVDLKSTAQGTLSSGEMIAVGGEERPANLFSMTLKGTARFDTARGVLLARDYETHGTLTSSSIDATGQKGYPWVQVVQLRWLAADAPAPQFGANQVIERLESETPPSTSRTANPPPPP